MKKYTQEELDVILQKHKASHLECCAFSNREKWVADFAGHDLRGLDFSNKCLVGVDFRFTDCTGVNFEGSDLTRAKFNSTDLRTANMSNTDFWGVSVYNSKLSLADLSGSKFGEYYSCKTSFIECELFETDFSNTTGEAKFIDCTGLGE